VRSYLDNSFLVWGVETPHCYAKPARSWFQSTF
jgi:hypothetical protein